MKGSLTSNGVFTKKSENSKVYYALNVKEAEAFKLRTEKRMENLSLKKKGQKKK